MKTQGLARAAAFGLALLLAATVAVLGGVSFQRQVASFQPIGFTGEPLGAGIVVSRVSDPVTGLAAGDHILDADGRTTSRPAELTAILRGAEETPLKVMRGEAIETVRYRRPAIDVDVPYLILALVGIAFLLIGLYTLVKDRRRRTALFYLWCMASAALFLVTPGAITARPDATTRLLFYVDQGARLLLPPLMVHLFLIFPDALGKRQALLRWTPFLYLPAAALLTLRLDLWLTSGRFLLGGARRELLVLLDRLEIGHLAVFALAAVAILVQRVLGERDWERARQVRWIVFGMAGGLLPFALFTLIPRTFGASPSESMTALTLLPLTLVPVTFAWAILRYKLWDIEVIVRDTISATLTVLLGIIGFSLVNLAIDRGLPQELEGTRNLVSFASGLAIAGLLLPTRRGIAAGLERFQYRDSFDKRRALGDLAEELVHEHDLARLCGRLLDQLESGVDVERANLYLGRGEVLVPVRPEPGLPSTLASDALGEEVWESGHRRLSGVALPSAERPPEQRLFGAGYRYAFPLSLRGLRIGLALTSYRIDDTPLNSDDMQLIRQLLSQAALAIENAQLLDQLKSKLDEVSELQRYNEGIIESSPAGIAVLDPGDGILSVNAAFADLVGESRQALVGRALTAVLPLPAVPAPGAPVTELAFCESDGRERHLQISASSFPRGDRPPLRIVVVHDVSERAAMEAALKEKDRLAALGALAAGVAHEVNTPITGISSYAQMLLAETDDADPRYQILKKVERQTFRATQIVNSLLEFARQRESEQAPVVLGELVEECLDLLKPRLAKNRVRVSWKQNQIDPIVVLGNAGELQQVVTNVLVNGSDAMAPTDEAQAGGELSVELGIREGRALLAVTDAGPGIPAERLQKIFEPFFTTKLGHGGTGLGLSISYEIVQRHGGELRVASELGKGSRFTIELPLFERPKEGRSRSEASGG